VNGPEELVTRCGKERMVGPGTFVVETRAKPMVHCNAALPHDTRQRLRDLGYPVDDAPEPHEAWAVELEREAAGIEIMDDTVHFVREHDSTLVRLEPWPVGYRSCLSVSSDLDALTLLDFAMRLKEF
jgi:hypothetical protein